MRAEQHDTSNVFRGVEPTNGHERGTWKDNGTSNDNGSAAAVLPLPHTIGELRPGDLVFCARPSLLQRWGEIAGGQWRHAGVIVASDQGLQMSGFGRKQKYSLYPLDILSTYTRIGVASVHSSDEVAKLHRWLERFEAGPACYATSVVVLGGIYSATRQLRDGVLRAIAVVIAAAFCALQALRPQSGHSFVCSTFVLAAVNASRAASLEVPMVSSRYAKARRSGSRSRPTFAKIDRLLARWLASPTDLWDAIAESNRTELDLSVDSEHGHTGFTRRPVATSVAA